MNLSVKFLLIHSFSNSPYINPALSSSISITNSKFSHFSSNFFRSPDILRTHFLCQQCEISFFLTTPIYYSREDFVFENQIYTDTQLYSHDSSTLQILNCNFHDITSEQKGGAIRINSHIDSLINSTTFTNCFSDNEAAILFACEFHSNSYTWLLSPVTVNGCYCEGCSTSGNLFTIIDSWADKYPSVLFHFWMGVRSTTIPSKVTDTTIVDCQQQSDKRFGAFLHHHANRFTVHTVNCTNQNKVGSSELIFSQAQKEQSNINFLQGFGQSGHYLFDVTNIQSQDRITFNMASIINSTVITDTNNEAEELSALIHFSESYSPQTLIFVQCNFYNIDSNQPDMPPILFSNNEVPVFKNCLTNVESLGEDSYLQITVYDPDASIDTPTQDSPITEKTYLTTASTATPDNQDAPTVRPEKIDMYIIMVIIMSLTVLIMGIVICSARRYYYTLIRRGIADEEMVEPFHE